MNLPTFLGRALLRIAPLALVAIPFLLAACGKGSSGY
jgi:hypothetical protein